MSLVQNSVEATGSARPYPSWLPRAAILVGLGVVLTLLYFFRTHIPVGEWYGLLSLPSSNLTGPIDDIATAINLPLLSVFLFGLMGALSPCQLSTNLAAFAYTTRHIDRPERALSSGVAYLTGKILVYTLVGLAAVVLGLQLQQASIPVIVAARKALGPLLLVIGLSMLGVIGLQFSTGSAASSWFRRQATGRGVFGAFLMGVAFSFAFCPTLFWLFFGLTLPLALASEAGFVYPAIFALGTTLPLLAFISLAALGGLSVGGFVQRARGVSFWLNRAVAIVFLLVGLNEIVLYWLT